MTNQNQPKKYYTNCKLLPQKLCGLFLIMAAILVFYINDHDVTISILLMPFGLYLLFSKKYLMYQ